MTFGDVFKDVGHTVSQGSKSIGHVFTGGANAVSDVYHDVTGAVSTVYKDGRSAVSYTGKHAIKDVDTLTNAISSPMMWIVVGGVVILLLANR